MNSQTAYTVVVSISADVENGPAEFQQGTYSRTSAYEAMKDWHRQYPAATVTIKRMVESEWGAREVGVEAVWGANQPAYIKG